MNAYNPLASMKRLEDAGVPRPHAEAIASEISEGTNDFVTKNMLEAALDKQTIKISIIMAGMLTLTCTIIGTIVGLIAAR